jgi:hypothetical protein
MLQAAAEATWAAPRSRIEFLEGKRTCHGDRENDVAFAGGCGGSCVGRLRAASFRIVARLR